MLEQLATVVLSIHVIVAIFLVGLILTQKNEGGMGGLGGGASGGMAGFLSGRAQSNLLTKATKWLAVGFFCTSLFLAYADSHGGSRQPLVGSGAATTSAPAAPSTDPAAPAVDSGTTPPVELAPTAPVEPVAPSGQ
jgi:preprotein translocase subunit SecG